MEYHLERGLRLHKAPEHENLYNWAIIEVDAQGRQVGEDQIPWDWTLYFTATSCVLADSIDIKSQFQMEQSTSAAPEVVQRQVIRVRLRPGHPQDEGDYRRETTFSMFGTDRAIKSFQLNIHPIADPAEQESCTALGSVSYTAETDFRDETEDDWIIFNLFVKPETFARYAAKVAHDSVDEMILSVGRVDGFYSEWSPSITTRNVKVLTEGSDQKILLPPGHQVEPPRLGHTGAAELYINRRLVFGNRAPNPDAVEELVDIELEPSASEAQTRVKMDPRMFQMLASLSRAARFVVCLLAIIVVTTMLNR